MANVFDSFPSKYLRAADLPDEGQTYMMADVTREPVGQGDDQESKLILYFDGEKRGLVLNKTNATTIAEMYGPDTDDWEGCPITLFPTQTDYQGKQVECIRIRKRKPKAEAPAQIKPAARKPERAINPDADDPDIPF